MTRVALTLAEAAPRLDPPMTRRALEDIVRHLPKIRPVGTRASGKGTSGGRPARTYDFDTIIELHADLARWMR